MKILLTGFDPFGGESVNPALEAVKQLPDTIAGAEVIKLEIPTVFRKSLEKIEENIVKHNPDIVISVGHYIRRWATCLLLKLTNKSYG